jgi:molybdopterin-guanine dinucleotide biosynthesis protein MobB
MPVPDPDFVIVGFVGSSGVGKTTLLEHLIAALSRRGLAVGAVKHASHGFLADHPGKDSHRLYESGADAVTLISREQIASFRRAEGDGAGEVSLAAALAALPRGLDVVLAEGFSWEPIPRVVLFHASEEPRREHLEGGEVLELVSVPTSSCGKPPVFSDALIESLVRTVAATVAGHAAGAGQTFLAADPDRRSA